MKKLFSILATVILLISLTVVASATGNTYTVKEFDLQITVPESYKYVIMRDTEDDNAVFSDLNVTKDQIMTMFENGNIYFNALPGTSSEEFLITEMDIDFKDLSKADDGTVQEMKDSLASEYQRLGALVLSSSVEKYNGITYISSRLKDNSANMYIISFYTIKDGQAFTFNFRTPSTITSDYENMVFDVMNSVKYNASEAAVDTPVETEPVQKPQETPEETEEFEHKDKDSGAKFTVPENWKFEEMDDSEFLKAKFVSTKDPTKLLMFGSAYIWDEVTEEERNGLSIEEFDIEAYSAKEVAEWLDLSEEEIVPVQLNGETYYRGVITQDVTVEDTTVTVTLTQLMYIKDGWMYAYQYTGNPSDAMYKDLEALIESVDYPVRPTDDKETPADDEKPSDAKDEDDDTTTIGALEGGEKGGSNMGLIIGVVIAVVIVVAVILIVVLGKKKKEGQNVPPPQYNQYGQYPNNQQYNQYPNNQQYQNPQQQYYGGVPQQPQQPAQQSMYCPHCGQVIPADTKFCSFCGKQVQ